MARATGVNKLTHMGQITNSWAVGQILSGRVELFRTQVIRRHRDLILCGDPGVGTWVGVTFTPANVTCKKCLEISK